jgi:hypothetical protein
MEVGTSEFDGSRNFVRLLLVLSSTYPHPCGIVRYKYRARPQQELEITVFASMRYSNNKPESHANVDTYGSFLLGSSLCSNWYRYHLLVLED